MPAAFRVGRTVSGGRQASLHGKGGEGERVGGLFEGPEKVGVSVRVRTSDTGDTKGTRGTRTKTYGSRVPTRVSRDADMCELTSRDM